MGKLYCTLLSDRLTGKKVNKNKWNIISCKQIAENAMCIMVLILDGNTEIGAHM